MPVRAGLYIAAVTLAGGVSIADGLHHWGSADISRFVAYLLLGLLASGMKVALPAITGTMSVNFLFVLLGIAQLTLAETLAIGCSSAIFQCFWSARRRPGTVQVIFNAASMGVAVWTSYGACHSRLIGSLTDGSTPVLLLAAASTFFFTNTISIAGVIALTERKSVRKIWQECYFWSFPYYLIGAAIAGLITAVSGLIGWQSALLVLPVTYFFYRSYRLYLSRLEAEKTHVEEMAALHLRTIEALALAIDAKDLTTHDHLRRVQVYAVEVGKELGLDETELQALRAASVLHDIGKLGVPEHIISKPGRLTPEEFEKMKIHPVVGAEILAEVKFPYPVVPIVRAHHERWDGSGYPDGLKESDIPLGARILAAVDCLDALASDRQYRRALPLDEAMRKVAGEAGLSFDPQVVEVLERRYADLDRLAQTVKVERARLWIGMKVEKGSPASGFDNSGEAPSRRDQAVDFLTSIAAARSEVQMLFELANDLGNSLSLDETLSVLAVRLKRMIPYDAIAIYVRREDKLIPEYVNGDNFRLFASLEIPVGQGLSGWVAENQKPIVNGNPSVEPGYLNDPSKFSTLRSALAVPLEGLTGIVGVLALYHAEKDNFNRDHLRILLAISSKIALSVENALKYRWAESSATTDDLTGLPNARSLFLHLDGELARSKRSGTPLGVLVCDLDGFKQVNDRFGHLEGNRVLREVAKALRETCREYDYAARMGGDEFVLVSPGLKKLDADALTGRLREVVSAAGNAVCGESLLSLSVGAALYPEDGADAEQLLTEADRRMYKAKQRHKSFVAGLAAGCDSSAAAPERDCNRDLCGAAGPARPAAPPATSA